MTQEFSVGARLRSFRYAFQGLRWLLVEQHNARIHLLATVLVVIAGCYFQVHATHWALLILAMAGVWLAEGMNTALEYLADATVPEQHPLIGKAKDVAAATVLITALAAVLIGALVFLPYLTP